MYIAHKYRVLAIIYINKNNNYNSQSHQYFNYVTYQCSDQTVAPQPQKRRGIIHFTGGAKY